MHLHNLQDAEEVDLMMRGCGSAEVYKRPGQEAKTRIWFTTEKLTLDVCFDQGQAAQPMLLEHLLMHLMTAHGWRKQVGPAPSGAVEYKLKQRHPLRKVLVAVTAPRCFHEIIARSPRLAWSDGCSTWLG